MPGVGRPFGDVVVTEAVGPWAGLLRWSGLAVVAAGVLMVVATLLHPTHETATTIVASEGRLIAAHVTYTLSWLLVLLGLPGLFAAQRASMGRLGVAGFLAAFAGTYLIAVTGNFGFLAPVLAKKSPAVLDALNQYPPVVVINGLAAVTFMIGYVLFGIAMTRTAPSWPRLSGILVAVGAPAHLLGFGLAQLVSPALWPIAVVGSVSLGAGLAWPGYRLWRTPAASDQSPSRSEVRGMSTDSSQDVTAHRPGTAERIRLIVFRVLATLAGLFFLVAVVLMASAPWVLLQPGQDPHADLNRWFLAVAGSVDAIAVGVWAALVHRPRRTLLVVEMAGAVIVAGAIILPFQPTFAAILAVAVVPLIAYPYWRDVRGFPSWWAGAPRGPLILAALAGMALLVTAAIALPRQIGGTDPAAQAGWWSDYAEHATVLALAGVLAASRGPGWRILTGLCSAVWLYLGLVATLVLPHHTGSWGYIGGIAALLVGVGFALAAWRAHEQRNPPIPTE